MNDELDEPTIDIDVEEVLADQVSKGADSTSIANIPLEVFVPARKVDKNHNRTKEVIGRRKKNSKTFKTGEETFQVIIDKNNIHFTDENGDLKEVNLLIRDKNGKKIMTNADYKVRIFTDKVGYRLKQNDGTEFKIELVKVGDLQVDYTNLTYKVEGSQMFWDGVHEDLSMKLVLRSDKPELYTSIKTDSAPRKLKWKITQSGDFDFTSFGADFAGDSAEIITSKDVVDSDTFTYTEEWTGRVSRISDRKTRIKKWFSDPVYPVIIDPTATINLTANADDGQRIATSLFRTTKMSYVGVTSKSFSAGMRFQSVGVPSGATITSAFIKPQVKTVTSGIGAMKVVGNKVASAAAWNNSTESPLNMTKTTAKANWTPTVGLNSVAITAVVAEIVAQGGWASGNNMKFAFRSFAVSSKFAFIYDHNTTPGKAAQLVINYTTGGGGGAVYRRVGLLGVGQ